MPLLLKTSTVLYRLSYFPQVNDFDVVSSEPRYLFISAFMRHLGFTIPTMIGTIMTIATSLLNVCFIGQKAHKFFCKVATPYSICKSIFNLPLKFLLSFFLSFILCIYYIKIFYKNQQMKFFLRAMELISNTNL